MEQIIQKSSKRFAEYWVVSVDGWDVVGVCYFLGEGQHTRFTPPWQNVY